MDEQANQASTGTSMRQGTRQQANTQQLDYKRLIEAALFMSPNALSINDLSGITGVASTGHLEKALNELIDEYKGSSTALEIISINQKYMFSLKEPYASRVSNLASGPDISKGALRILAYVSKNNGVMQSEVVRIFGASTYDYMKELAEKEFVEAKRQGRSKKVTTTQKFSEYFKQ